MGRGTESRTKSGDRDSVLHGRPGSGQSIGHGSYVRLIKYCLFMGQGGLAERLVQTMVTRALELVSPVTLPRPDWLAELREGT